MSDICNIFIFDAIEWYEDRLDAGYTHCFEKVEDVPDMGSEIQHKVIVMTINFLQEVFDSSNDYSFGDTLERIRLELCSNQSEPVEVKVDFYGED